jgi:two-component system chemotaxis response regulator CheB
MLARPMPVVMVSSLTGKGTEAAVSALSLGALECFEKPRFGAARDTFARLADVLVDLSSASPKSRGTIRHGVSRTAVARERRWNGKKVLIGSSTGGVEALETIFADFPHDCPPTLVTQHMPAPFLSSFATRLNANVQPAVRLARDGDRVVEGEILIAPGGDCHMVVDPAGDVLRLRPGAKRSGHRPSVDLLFLSAVPQAKDFVAALLTGMGRDGAEGMAALRAEGAKTIAQDENSCVVYGMPRVAHMLGGVERTVPLARIASELLDATTDESREVQGNE